MNSANPISEEASARAYDQCKASGVLTERLLETFSAVAESATHPLTRNELYSILGKGSHHNPEGTYGRALSKLIDENYVEVLSSRKCSISGRECGVHTLTGYTGPRKKKAEMPTLQQKLDAARDAALTEAVHELMIFRQVETGQPSTETSIAHTVRYPDAAERIRMLRDSRKKQ